MSLKDYIIMATFQDTDPDVMCGRADVMVTALQERIQDGIDYEKNQTDADLVDEDKMNVDNETWVKLMEEGKHEEGIEACEEAAGHFFDLDLEIAPIDETLEY